MRIQVLMGALVFGFSALSMVSAASALTAVRAAPGLVCMSLDSQALGATNQSELPPVLAAPSPSASRIGYPTSIVFVKWPLQKQGGYVAMVRLNGQSGWIAANRLQPWRPPNGGTAKCVPSIMSNGRLGTTIH
jgi:hypothetical protein